MIIVQKMLEIKEVYIMGDLILYRIRNYKFRFIGDKEDRHIVTSPN